MLSGLTPPGASPRSVPQILGKPRKRRNRSRFLPKAFCNLFTPPVGDSGSAPTSQGNRGMVTPLEVPVSDLSLHHIKAPLASTNVPGTFPLGVLPGCVSMCLCMCVFVPCVCSGTRVCMHPHVLGRSLSGGGRGALNIP